MPVFKVQAPDGTVIKVEASDQETALRGAQEHYASIPKKPAAKPDTLKDMGRQFVGGLSEGVSGLADMVTQASPVGLLAGGLRNAAGVAELMDGKGGPNVTAAPEAQQQSNATRATPAAKTTVGRYARTAGQMVPNALAPGGLARRAANVILPAVGSEAAGEVAENSGANPFGVAAARTVGALGGAGLASARLANPFSATAAASPEEMAANIFAQRARVDPSVMRERAAKMEGSGVAPSLIDVGGDKGRRFIRAAGVKSEQSGEVLADNARRVSSSAKPAIMARTALVGPGKGTTSDDLLAHLVDAREQSARTNYGPAYATEIEVTPQIRSALGGKDGRAAIGRAIRAAEARRDVAALEDLRGLQRTIREGRPINPQPFSLGAMSEETRPMISAAALDRIQIALGKTARHLDKNDASDIAAGLKGRQTQINGALDAVPELGPARADYRTKSQAIEVLGGGPRGAKGRQDIFSSDPSSYGKWLQSLSPEARVANKVAIRQEILDTLGGQRSSTFGSVDELATSEYARDNLRQALGPEADRYIANLEGRLQQVRNARIVDPNAGARTAVLENDLQGVMRGVDIGKSAVRGDLLGVAGKLGQWFLSRGVSEQQAQALAEAAVDPQKLPQILSLIEGRAGKQGVQQFLELRNAALIGGASTARTAIAPTAPAGQ